MYSEESLILIKKLGGQCDIHYGYLAYVSDCHMTENWMLQTCDFIQNMWCAMLLSKQCLMSFLKKAIEMDFLRQLRAISIIWCFIQLWHIKSSLSGNRGTAWKGSAFTYMAVRSGHPRQNRNHLRLILMSTQFWSSWFPLFWINLYGKTSGIHLSDLVTKTYVTVKKSICIVEAWLPHG